MPVEPLILLIYFLAAARITGAIVDDVLFDSPRDAVLGWLDPTPGSIGAYVGKLITCQWCMGVWVCAVLVPFAWFHGHSPYLLIPATILAFAQLIGMSSQIGR